MCNHSFLLIFVAEVDFNICWYNFTLPGLQLVFGKWYLRYVRLHTIYFNFYRTYMFEIFFEDFQTYDCCVSKVMINGEKRFQKCILKTDARKYIVVDKLATLRNIEYSFKLLSYDFIKSGFFLKK